MPRPKLQPGHVAEVRKIKSRGPICASFKWVPCRVCLEPCPEQIDGNKHLCCVDPVAEPKKRAVRQPNQAEALF